MTSTETFERFWNGSDPGWVVLRHIENQVSTSIEFGATGPSARDIQALRLCVDRYRDLPASVALRELANVHVLDLGTQESTSARKLLLRLEAEGLRVIQRGEQVVSDIMFNELTNMAAVIEDELVARQVIQDALANGVVVRHVEN